MKALSNEVDRDLSLVLHKWFLRQGCHYELYYNCKYRFQTISFWIFSIYERHFHHINNIDVCTYTVCSDRQLISSTDQVLSVILFLIFCLAFVNFFSVQRFQWLIFFAVMCTLSHIAVCAHGACEGERLCIVHNAGAIVRCDARGCAREAGIYSSLAHFVGGSLFSQSH